MTRPRLRAAIAGFGHMHVNEIAEYLDGQPDFALVGAADVPLDLEELTATRYTRAWNQANVAERFHTPIFPSVAQMLDQLHPDICFILCDNAHKLATVQLCAERHIDVSIEKPLACSLDEAREIQRIVRQAGIQAVVNWPVIWRPYVQTFANAVTSGLCGRLIRLNYQNGHTGPLGIGAKHRGVAQAAEDISDAARARTWWYNRIYGGGAALDIGCYGCFFSQWLQSDQPVAASAIAMNLATPAANTEDHLAYLIRYPHALTVAEGTWTAPGASLPAGPTAFCTNGVISCVRQPDASVAVTAMDLCGNPIDVPAAPDSPYLKNLPWNLAGNRLHGLPLHPTVNLDHNVRIMALLDAAIQAAALHREVPVTHLD